MSTVIASSAPNVLLTRNQAAEYLGIRPQTLAAWALTGRYNLPMVKVGRWVRYRKSDLDAWLESRTVNCASEME